MNNTKYRIKIKSDGTSQGTTVTHIESGANIPVSKINFVMEANGPAKVELTIDGHFIDFDIEARASIHKMKNIEAFKGIPRIH
ncbi:MAG: hypothetical protein GY870_04710 [archaeon]|nr:hypothetical protein [archaeon]